MHNEALKPLIDIEASLASVSRQYGAPMCKLREDLDRYQQVIAEDQPEVIVECGTWRGASARWFTDFGADVITIDVARTHEAQGDEDHITWITGNSADPKIAAHVTDLVAGRRTMVVLDSDHSGHHVAAEIALYAPLVSPGCHLVVEDAIVRWIPDDPATGSPMDAIEELLVGNPDFVRDEKTETLHPVSMYPCGWWIRT